jgi:hypothetical protein
MVFLCPVFNDLHNMSRLLLVEAWSLFGFLVLPVLPVDTLERYDPFPV